MWGPAKPPRGELGCLGQLPSSDRGAVAKPRNKLERDRLQEGFIGALENGGVRARPVA